MKTDWFTDNIDSIFFKSDTIRLIQHTNYGPEWAKDDYAEYEMKCFDHGDYLNFGFKRFGQFKYWETNNNYKNSVPIADFTWKFDKTVQILTVFKEKELQFKLKPLSKRQIKIESRFAGQAELTSNELTFIKIEEHTANNYVFSPPMPKGPAVFSILSDSGVLASPLPIPNTPSVPVRSQIT